MKKSLHSEKTWFVKPSHPQHAVALSKSLSILPVTAQILIHRGIKTVEEARAFLECRLKDLSDPFLMKDMDRAVERIFLAKERNEKVLVHGDYDVDGITGTALLCEIFGKIGIQAQPYIPHRVNEGYGISLEAIRKAKDEGFRLIVTVDCGASAVEEIRGAVDLGLDVIVADHHELRDPLPECSALIHPKRTLKKDHIDDLAAVGVAFKIAHGLIKEGLKLKMAWASSVDLKDYLDWVALGTVADLVPIKGENKILVKRGLEKLEHPLSIGLRALIKQIGLEGKSLSTVDIGFRIAPRMNAAGRVGEAYNAIKLLLTRDLLEAEQLARLLDLNNQERQAVELKTFEEALCLLEKEGDLDSSWVLVLHQDRWPLGVIGIVASRIVKTHHRPTFIISSDQGMSKGSARSIRGFHLCEALKQCEDLLCGYGGHAYAAGIKITNENISKFKERLNHYAHQVLTEKDLIPSIEIDLNLPFHEVTLKLAEELEKLAPYGQENQTPVFLSEGLLLDRDPQIVGKDHLKLWIKQKDSTMVEGIGFGMAEWASHFRLGSSTPFQAVYEIGINQYNGQKKVQLMLKDFKF